MSVIAQSNTKVLEQANTTHNIIDMKASSALVPV